MKVATIINKLRLNLSIIENNLTALSVAEILFRPNVEHWCLLEIICHLVDEEKDDFRMRVKHTLENPETQAPGFNPLDWVTERAYMQQDFKSKLQEFVQERKKSIAYLEALESPIWENGYTHKSAGRLTAFYFLNNWLAHDYLHLRQITKVKYEYLKSTESAINYDYAGNWVL